MRNLTATIRVHPMPDPKPIEPAIYGHFLESAFFGNIEGGIFDEGSPLSITDDGPLRGCRADVIQACRELGLSVVRWPGGNFTSPYRWEDGTGPRDDRPRRLELAWGSEENNRFGTPEFLAWCEAVGTTPYLAHSARDVEDAVRWVEYTNYDGDTTLTRRRASDGLPTPVRVPYWGVGNEVYGKWQMGHRSVDQYVVDAKEHARFMRRVDPEISLVAVGNDRPEWTEAVVEGLGDLIDFVSLHLYGASRHITDPSESEFDAIVAQSAYFERQIVAQSDTIAAARAVHGSARAIAIAMDEWNIRHLEPASWPQPQPGPDGGTGYLEEIAPSLGSHDGARVNRYSSRTLADAIFYAGVFHAMHRASQRAVPVGMANTVNLINANGLLEVRPDGLVKAATYHVWDLYQNHTGSIPLAVDVTAPSRTIDLRLGETYLPDGTFRTVPATVAMLDVSATTSADGVISIVVINRSAANVITARLSLEDNQPATSAIRRTIGANAEDLFAVNRLSDPDAVSLSDPEPIDITDGQVAFAAHSITLLSIETR